MTTHFRFYSNISWLLMLYETWGYYIEFDPVTPSGCIADVSKYYNTSMGHGFKDITLFVERHIPSKTNCHNLMLVRDLPPGVPAWSEMRLLAYFICHRAILSSSVALEMCCWLQHTEFNNFSKLTASDNYLGWGKVSQSAWVRPYPPHSYRMPFPHWSVGHWSVGKLAAWIASLRSPVY